MESRSALIWLRKLGRERRSEPVRKIGTFGMDGVTGCLSKKATLLSPRAEFAGAKRHRAAEGIQGQGVRKRCSLIGVKMPASL